MNIINHQHFILFKPYGYVSQFISNEPRKHKKKYLGEFSTFPEGTMAIGRLDEHSEGLLLLTTDGKVSAHITGKKIEKEYFAQVDGLISIDVIAILEKGVEISVNGAQYQTLPCKVQLLETPDLPERAKKIRDDRHGPTSWIGITLKEGKFRQVRKMTAAVGYPTLRLVRTRIGDISLNKMQPGEVLEVEKLV